MNDELNKARAYAMRLLGFRSQSVAEMQKKMIRKKFSRSTVQAVVNELRSQGYLNDNRFAKELIQSTVRRKAVGQFYLRKKLLEHGISESIINDILAKELPEDKEKELAREAAAHKIEEFQVKLSRISTMQKGKLARFLNSRGFAGDIIREILDELT